MNNKINYIKKIIKDKKIKLSKNERKVLEIFLDDKNREIFDITTLEIEKKYGINKSILTRFSKKLGFNGFNELRYKLNDVFDVHKEENIVVKSYLDVIKETEMLTTNVIDIIKRFEKFEKIYVFGMGESSFISYELEYLLTKNGLNNIVSLSSHYQATLKFDMLNENSLFICISLSGQNHIAIDLTKRAKQKKAKILLITNNENSYLKKLATGFIKVANNGKYYEVSKMLPLLLVVELIVYQYKTYKNNRIRLKKEH